MNPHTIAPSRRQTVRFSELRVGDNFLYGKHRQYLQGRKIAIHLVRRKKGLTDFQTKGYRCNVVRPDGTHTWLSPNTKVIKI